MSEGREEGGEDVGGERTEARKGRGARRRRGQGGRMREGEPQGARAEGARRPRRLRRAGRAGGRGAGRRRPAGSAACPQADLLFSGRLVCRQSYCGDSRCSVRLAGSQAGCRPRPPPPSARRAVHFTHSSFPGKAGIPSQSQASLRGHRASSVNLIPAWDLGPESRLPSPWGWTRLLCSGTLNWCPLQAHVRPTWWNV